MQINIIVFLIFAVLVAAFAVQNTMPVVVKFLLWEANLSLVLVILGSVAVGAILLFTINIVKQHSGKREMKEMARQVLELTRDKAELEKTLAGMKQTLTVSDTEAPSQQTFTQEAPHEEEPHAPELPDMKNVTTLEELDRVIGSENASL